MKWITREHPKIDRVACPWFITRFIDKQAATGAIPYDVPGVDLTHVGELCSFDAFLKKNLLDTPALHRLAVIVRGADTNQLHIAPQSAGLLAISLGLSRNFRNDFEMLAHGMVLYDALFAWCTELGAETHSWKYP